MKSDRDAEREFLAERLRPVRKKPDPRPVRIPIGEADELDLSDAEREALFTPTMPADL